VKRLVLALVACLLLPSAPASAQELLAGVGRADITPPTGYVLGGWVRADRTGEGVHTRLNATAIVLQRGDRKVALVSMDLFMVPGGLLKEAAGRNADLGFSEENVLASASHTHAGPTGFANFTTYNTTAPSTETTNRPETFVNFFNPEPPDPQLYTFLVERLALAIRQAARGARPAAVGWGQTSLTSVTKNRSIEAHLADHGIIEEPGQGRPDEDPDGVLHTIDPEVHVLRVDRLVVRSKRCGPRPRKLAGRRRTCRRHNRRRVVRIPIGAWSSFANHGTVNPAEYEVYNRDHHGAAVAVFEKRLRDTGKVSAKRMIVNVYGNSNEGDQSAGLDSRGPAHAELVGRREADAMFEAWQEAARAMSTRPQLDLRWTRTCFCGQEVPGGRVASEPMAGIPFLTGSEEGRGPLYDETGVPFEGRRTEGSGFESQGHKVGVPGATSTETVPQAVPLMTVRVADRVIASLPAEPTVEVGRRVRQAVLGATRGAGVRRVIVSGLANEFIQYLTTPEEYDRQHYEGGSTLYGPLSAVLLTQELGTLAGRMARGEPAQPAHPFDPRNGVRADAAPFPAGAGSGTIETQPAGTAPRPQVVWRGGERGYDRPLDTPFITVERRVGGGWRRHTDDLWLDIVWQLTEGNRYTATWNAPAGTPAGTYRFVITARRYKLESAPFTRG
jgi:hypothetical protein